MKAEIIAVGTELLLGQIVNTNAQFISQELAALGIDVYFQTVVGDNEERIKAALQIASNRADLLILTGGIGPTQDDLTKQTLAAWLGRPLEIHQPSLDKIVDMFAQRKKPMPANNERQALILSGSDPFFNHAGLAVGIGIRQQDHCYIVLPGPPREMKAVFKDHAVDWINRQMKNQLPLISKILKFAGIGESSVEERLNDLISAQQEITIAPYAKEGEVSLRISVKASDRLKAEQLMQPLLVEIRNRLESHLFAEEDIHLEEAVVALLKEKNLSLSLAESCSGGWVSKLITSVPAISQFYKGGIVCYTNESKMNILGVNEQLLKGPRAVGAVSEQMAAEMSQRALTLFHSDLALSVTGVTGPDTIENKKIGEIYIGLSHADVNKKIDTEVFPLQLSGNRQLIQRRVAKHALYVIWQKLQKLSK